LLAQWLPSIAVNELKYNVYDHGYFTTPEINAEFKGCLPKQEIISDTALELSLSEN
jgi:hypothetical protein